MCANGIYAQISLHIWKHSNGGVENFASQNKEFRMQLYKPILAFVFSGRKICLQDVFQLIPQGPVFGAFSIFDVYPSGGHLKYAPG
jgi:hypothetical protein